MATTGTAALQGCIAAAAVADPRRFSVRADAVLGSSVEGSDEKAVAKVMAAIADRVVHDMGTPYTFPSTHRRILEPYDYYAFGQASLRNSLPWRDLQPADIHDSSYLLATL